MERVAGDGVCVDSSSSLSGSSSSGIKIATVLVGQVIFSVMSVDKITFKQNEMQFNVTNQY